MSGDAVNAVDVDPQSIAAELAALAPDNRQGEAPADAQVSAADVDWSAVMLASMQMFARVVAPNWELDEGEQAIIATQGAAVLDAFFPDIKLEQRWIVLCVFVLSTGGIVLRRYDDSAGQFKPLRKRKPKSDSPARAGSATETRADKSDAAARAGSSSDPRERPAAPLASVPG